jgi:GR25 family glycosyltransferase involved in LPS biosynthesis
MTPIYWINLSFRDDRRKHMYNQLKSFYNIRITPEINIKPEISCCKAHYNAILTAWYDNVDYALIVEDDIENVSEMFELDFYKKLFEFNNWDIIQLHYICPEFLNAVPKLNYGHCLVKGYLTSTACYLITRNGMYNLLYTMSDPKFKLWLEFTKNNPDILKLNKTEQKKHPLWTLPSLNVSFMDNSYAEEFVYRYVNTYFSLYPLINTIEKADTDIQKTPELSYFNMLMINNLFKSTDIKKLLIESFILELPYDTHWFNSWEEAYSVILDYSKHCNRIE